MTSIRALNLLAMTALVIMGIIGAIAIHRMVSADLGSGLLSWAEDGAFLSLAYGACLVLGVAGATGTTYWILHRR
jgi:hypothetical protein